MRVSVVGAAIIQADAILLITELVKTIDQMMLFVKTYPCLDPLFWIWIGYLLLAILKDFFMGKYSN